MPRTLEEAQHVPAHCPVAWTQTAPPRKTFPLHFLNNTMTFPAVGRILP